MVKMKDTVSKVLEHRPLGGDFYLMALENPHVARQARPGQFLMVATCRPYGPLLRRPFGVMNVENKASRVWIYYEKVGRGTGDLSLVKTGDTLRVLGPLGNGFPTFSGRRILLIAGGRGIAPLFFAARRLVSDNHLVLVYGARSRSGLHLTDRIDRLKLAACHYCTEDGSRGRRGRVTDQLGELVARHRIDATLSCGPEVMFRALYRLRNQLPAENHLSAEARMGCGFGICHSCAVSTTDGYRKACTDGPVFPLEAIRW